jgi:hypothetical protein
MYGIKKLKKLPRLNKVLYNNNNNNNNNNIIISMPIRDTGEDSNILGVRFKRS